MTITANKTGSETQDFSGSSYNPLPVRPPRLYESPATPNFPYPILFDGSLNDYSAYQYLWGAGFGLCFPVIGFDLNGSNWSPDYVDPATCIVFRSPVGNGDGAFSWNIIPLEQLAVGPDTTLQTDIMPAYPNLDGQFSGPLHNGNHGDYIPNTVDGNGRLYGCNDGRVIIGNVTDKSWYQCFLTIDEGGFRDSSTWTDVTLAGGDGYNTTWIEKNSGVTPAQYITRWKQTAVGGAFDMPVQDYVQLSDAADDIIFQNAMQYNIGYHIAANTQGFIFTTVDTNGPTPVFVAFVFSADISTYKRVDITAPSGDTDGVYFEDIDGGKYFVDSSGFANSSPPIVDSTTLPLMQVFNLGCWSPCANLVHQFLSENQS